MTPKIHVITRTDKIPPIDHDALIVRLSRSNGVTYAVVESHTLINGDLVTKLLFERRRATKESALQLATDLAKITGTKDIYVLQETDAPDSSSTP